MDHLKKYKRELLNMKDDVVKSKLPTKAEAIKRFREYLEDGDNGVDEVQFEGSKNVNSCGIKGGYATCLKEISQPSAWEEDDVVDRRVMNKPNLLELNGNEVIEEEPQVQVVYEEDKVVKKVNKVEEVVIAEDDLKNFSELDL